MAVSLALALALLSDAGADGPISASATITAGRTAALTATVSVGRPIERAVAGRTFSMGVGQDRQQHWTEAASFYQQAVLEWSTELRVHPGVALERAVQKAERERQRSVMLANLDLPRPGQPESVVRAMTLERARLLRTKMMVVRANSGAVPDELYARTRQSFDDALRAGEVLPIAVQSEIHLLLCAAHAAAGARAAARLALSQVSTDQQQEPVNALAMATCTAALGDDNQALNFLEAHLLQRLDPFTQRELFLANDWDRLRGQPRFENLFASLARY
jgi:hypothetical protein